MNARAILVERVDPLKKVVDHILNEGIFTNESNNFMVFLMFFWGSGRKFRSLSALLSSLLVKNL